MTAISARTYPPSRRRIRRPLDRLIISVGLALVAWGRRRASRHRTALITHQQTYAEAVRTAAAVRHVGMPPV